MERRESETVEFKKTTSQLKEGVISLCAMLNKHEHGVVYFGIKDDGSTADLTIGKKTTSDISHEIRNNLKPLPEISISIITVDERNIIKVVADGKDTPYSAYGRYYIRIDDADMFMDSKQLWTFFESKDKTYSKWEEEITPYGIEKINEELLIQFIKVCAENNVDYEYHNDEFGFTFKFKRNNISYQNDTKKDMLKPVDRQILEMMNDNAYVTIPEIATSIGVSIPTVNRHIKELVNDDMIKRVGSRKTGFWKVK